jgi:hypothetical protein
VVSLLFEPHALALVLHDDDDDDDALVVVELFWCCCFLLVLLLLLLFHCWSAAPHPAVHDAPSLDDNKQDTLLQAPHKLLLHLWIDDDDDDDLHLGLTDP